jgi:hypothetical protein
MANIEVLGVERNGTTVPLWNSLFGGTLLKHSLFRPDTPPLTKLKQYRLHREVANNWGGKTITWLDFRWLFR